MEKSTEVLTPNANKCYEEWRGQNTVKKDDQGRIVVTFEKVKKIKDVWISEDTAGVLNESAESPATTNPIMYLLKK